MVSGFSLWLAQTLLRPTRSSDGLRTIAGSRAVSDRNKIVHSSNRPQTKQLVQTACSNLQICQTSFLFSFPIGSICLIALAGCPIPMGCFVAPRLFWLPTMPRVWRSTSTLGRRLTHEFNKLPLYRETRFLVDGSQVWSLRESLMFRIQFRSEARRTFRSSVQRVEATEVTRDEERDSVDREHRS